MCINSPLRPFIDSEIDMTIPLDGVYGLYDGSDVIYFGKGEGIGGVRGRLKRHKAGYEGECTQRATHFNYEICSNPSRRETELLAEYLRLYWRLPRCNSIISQHNDA